MAWLQLVRVEHALMSALGVLIGLLLAAGSLNGLLTYPLSTLLLALAVPLFINIGAFALNDYWDVEADRANGRLERPLVSGALSPSLAAWTGGLGLALGLVCGHLLNPLSGLLAALFAFLSLAYNRYLKDWPLVGNLCIAASMAIAFAFGSIALGVAIERLSPPVALLSIGALLSGLGRELVKTVQDMEGDQAARHSKSLPHLVGERPSLLLAALCYAAFAITAVLLLFSGLRFSVLSAGLLLLSVLAFLTLGGQLVRLKTGAHGEKASAHLAAALEKMRKASLWALLIGLLAIMLAAL